MPTYLELINPNDKIQELSHQPIILNDLSYLTTDDQAYVDGITLTKFKGDLLENLPKCECNKFRGYPDLGVVCDVCGYEVVDPHGALEAITWIRAPEGVKAMITPEFLLMLREAFTASRFSVIDWLIDPYYIRRVNNYPAWMVKVELMNLPRGWNNFLDNFDRIIEQLATVKEFQKQSLTDFLQLVKENRNKLFCNYIAVPNKAILVLEEETTATYVDTIFIGATDAIRKMVGIDTVHSSLTREEKEKRTYSLLSNLATFYDDISQAYYASKKGIFRKHLLGTRCSWAFRAVISSIDGPSTGDEMHIPWGVAVCVFRTHLTSLLLAKGFTPNQAKQLIADSVHTYNKLLHDLMLQLIEESPEKGIRANFNRNPSMSRSSIVSMLITKIKTNMLDKTVSVPNWIVKLLNGDFDGDECNFTLDIDNYMSGMMSGFRPEMNLYNPNKVRSFDGLLALPKPQAAMLDAMFQYEPD